jgi:hypothetical protein
MLGTSLCDIVFARLQTYHCLLLCEHTICKRRTALRKSAMSEKREKPSTTADPLAGYPAQLRHSTTNPGVVYVRASGLFAVRGGAEMARSVADAPVFSLQTDAGDDIRVYRGAPALPGPRMRAVDAPHVIAVYELGRSLAPKASKQQAASKALAVPTGRLLVRFGDAVKAETRAEALRKLGYRITQVLSYAPNAAWLESIEGEQAALCNIAAIESLSDVVNVEPQFLTPRSTR